MNRAMPRVLVLAPGGAEGIAPLVAAGRAGAIGLLDLSAADPGECRAALDRAARWADRPFGVRVGAAGADLPAWPERLAVVAVVEDRSTDWAAALGPIADRGLVALAEVTGRDAASAAMAAGAAGLIVAGPGGRRPLRRGVVVRAAPGGARRRDGSPGLGPRRDRPAVGRGRAWRPGRRGSCSTAPSCWPASRRSTDDDRDRIARPRRRRDGGDRPGRRADRAGRRPAGLGRRRPAPRGGRGRRRGVASGRRRGGRLASRPGEADRPGRRLRGRPREDATRPSAGSSRAVEAAIDEGLGGRGGGPAAGGGVADGRGARHALPDRPGADDPGQRRRPPSPRRSPRAARCRSSPWRCSGAPRSAALLAETADRLGGRPWGVGLLGFVDPALRAEQVAAIREARPPFALIAGGRPDQAAELERIGIATFLHAPSPALLGQFLRDGARRFVLEGRECGGHVGPRSSLVLWEQAAARCSAAIDDGRVADPAELHLALRRRHPRRPVGGRRSRPWRRRWRRGACRSASWSARPTCSRERPSTTGAIVPRFQREAVALPRDGPAGDRPGARGPRRPLAVRRAVRGRAPPAWPRSGASADEIREALERLNVGRLRVAAKGLDRADGPGSPLVAADRGRAVRARAST